MYSIGVDGGGTRTRAVLVDEGGRIRSWALSGRGNYQVIGLKGMEALLESLLQKLGVERGGEMSLCMGMAGAGRPEEQRAIADLVRSRGWKGPVQVVSDARAALEGAHGGRAGIIAISGTGSIVLGKDQSGRDARAGGWGPLLGDDGSGYWIGLDGLRAVFRTRDGWGEETVLCERLRAALGLENWDAAVAQVYGGTIGRDRIAALAPHVFAAARKGDPVADRIVDAAGEALGRQIRAVAGRLEMSGELELVCVGGVFKERERLWPVMERVVQDERIVRLRHRRALLPPVLGAVLLARRQAGQSVDSALVEQMRTHCPPEMRGEFS